MPSSTSNSSGAGAAGASAAVRAGDANGPKPIDGLRHADELDEAHREIPERPWGKIALSALVLTVALMGLWEALWRNEGYRAGDIKDSNAGWAEQRRRAEGNATVLIGSSRNLYDVNLNTWQKTTGVRPVQLSLAGTSPRFVLDDLAKDPKFHGLVVADVVPNNFFREFAGRNAAVLPYYKRETPSQRAGRYLSIWPEEGFAYIDDQTRPKELWRRLVFPTRPGQRAAFVDPYKMSVFEADRNARLWDRVLTDEAYRLRAIRIWGQIFTPRPGEPPPDAGKVIAEVAANVAKIRARCGNVVFVAHPVSGFLAAMEARNFPRQRFWDPLIAATHAVGIRNDDHPELQGFRLPELSHMDPRDTATYTARLAPLVEVAGKTPMGAVRPNQPNGISLPEVGAARRE